MAHEAAEARQADPDDSSDAPLAPDDNNNDKSNPPNQEGDFD